MIICKNLIVTNSERNAKKKWRQKEKAKVVKCSLKQLNNLYVIKAIVEINKKNFNFRTEAYEGSSNETIVMKADAL